MFPEEIMQAIRQRLGLDENDTSRDAEIAKMTLEDALDAYLTWEGVEGYTENILAIVAERLQQSLVNTLGTSCIEGKA